MHFLKQLVEEEKFIAILTTHSTAILGALEKYNDLAFNFMTKKQTIFNFKLVSEEYKSILPIFGAHPLSNIYCSTPIFLMEGDDEMWIWQKAIRTSGILKLFPCEAEGASNIVKYENKINEILESVYDAPHAQGYSLRDRDDDPPNKTLDNLGKIKRFILSCRASENLFLSDDVLLQAETSWDKLKADMDTWVTHNETHSKFQFMKKFKTEGYDRKSFKELKEIINIIAGLITTKPWQILIGQEIGKQLKTKKLSDELLNENSLASYLGEDLVVFLNSNLAQ